MVDIPGNNTTTTTVTVSSSTTNALEVIGDHDWFKINLTSGQEITVALDALGTSPTLDTYLIIRDSEGNILYEDDDIHTGVDTDSLLSFAADYTGVYYIDVGAFEDASAGDYRLNVTAFQDPPVFTTDQIAEQLVSGYWGDGEHPFNVSPGGTITVSLVDLTADGQNLARKALQAWSEITGLNFSEVSGDAQIIFSDLTGPTDGGAWTESFYDENEHYSTSAHVNIDEGWLTTYGAQVGSYSYHAYLHEIGHALGLGHAGNYNAIPATYPYDALFLNDSWATSVMSYFNQEQSEYFSDLGFTYLNLVTPMVADIVAIQQLYGLSTTTRLGNTTYGFNSNAGNQIYNANVSTGGITNVALTIFDTGGTDTLDYSGFTGAQKIDLNPESFSDVLGQTGNLSIARGTIIENATGGSGADMITGNGYNNTLRGGDGADTLKGRNGNDVLIGGAGNDILVGGDGNDTYQVESSGDQTLESVGRGFDIVMASSSYTLIGGAEIEELRASDLASTDPLKLFGNDFAQTVRGNAGNNSIKGLGGNDILIGGGGEDLLLGGAGDDIYHIDSAGDRALESVGRGMDTVLSSVSFTLEAGSEIEVLRAMNASSTDPLKLFGNDLNQQITGNAGNNSIKGLGGNDVLIGGGGDDWLLGGAGNDTYHVDSAGDRAFESAGRGMDIVLSSVSHTLEGGSEIEVLRAMNASSADAIKLFGNDFNQQIIGNAGNNSIKGLGGNDILIGGGGEDLLLGGAGNDVYHVNSSGDRALESAGRGNDSVLTSISFTLEATSEIENLAAMDVANTSALSLFGNEFGQTVTGNAGSNVLRGFGGDDNLIGGGGNDRLDGGTGSNHLTGGAGVDRFVFAYLGVDDTITDFTKGEKIDLQDLDASTSLAGDQAFAWIGTNNFSNTAGQLRTWVENGDHYVAGDVNGDGIADFVINVGSYNIGATDFML